MVAAGNQVWVAWTQTTCYDWNTRHPRGALRHGACNYYYTGISNGYTSNTSVVVSRLFLGTGLDITFTETGLPLGHQLVGRLLR